MVSGEVTEHSLKLNDIERTWVEDRTYATEDGVGQFSVHVAICSCGMRFEGKDGMQVSRQFVSHVDALEGR